MTNAYLPKAHPVYHAVYERIRQGGDWADMDPVALRAHSRAMPRPPGYTVPETEVDERDIPVGDSNIKLITVRPPGSGVLPAFIYIHGGGWVFGDFHSHEKFAKDLAVRLNVAILFVEYSLSPEVKFPVATEECYNAILWIKDNADALKIDASKIVLGGDSAGGNLTAVCSILLKERGHPGVIKGQVLIYPATTNKVSTYPSYHEFGNGDFMLSRRSIEYFQGHYLEDKENPPADIRYAPILATNEQLKGLPPALTIVAECDVLRDCGEHYAQRLMDAGVDSYCVRVLGATHGFVSVPIETNLYRNTIHNIKSFVQDVLN